MTKVTDFTEVSWHKLLRGRMTKIEANDKIVRRLELDTKKGTLKWHVQKFLFIGGDETVVLKDARVSGHHPCSTRRLRR